MQTQCDAYVFTAVGEPLEVRQFPVPETLEPGAMLCRVRMSTICGSDLHTIFGRRKEAAPLILGHEIIGDVVAVGEGVEKDGFGDPLTVGDRISWTVMASCGKCFYCERELPQKCHHLKKYGHTCCEEPPHLTGGYAEYIYLFPGTTVYRIPETISDEIATPANCALATVVNAVETIELGRGETVLIQGAGLLGLNAAALAREAGAGTVIVTDVDDRRLDMASCFGADLCLNVASLGNQEALTAIRQECSGQGVDVAIEVCGAKESALFAVEALRIGGRYLVAGMVSPGSDLGIEGNQVTRKCLTIKGIHNYRPAHLGAALEFLEQCQDEYPYPDLVSATYPLSEVNEAIQVAESGIHVRVGLR